MRISAGLPLIVALCIALGNLFFISRKHIQTAIHCIGTVIYLSSVIYLYWQVQTVETIELNIGGFPNGVAIALKLDHFSCLMMLITALIVLAVTIFSYADSTIAGRSMFYPLFWFLILGITGVFSTADLFNLYVWFEVMVISSFVLLIQSRNDNCLKGAKFYVSLNLFATLIMLLGVSFIYGLTSTLDMTAIAQWAHQSPAPDLFFLCLTLLLIAFAIKSALFPFYFWLPESYHLTSVSTGALFAGLLTKVGVYALIRTGSLFIPFNSIIMQGVLIISCFTMISGVLGAMSDFNLRRILSFHIISQVGYMTLAFAMGSVLALAASLFYIIHHILVKTNLFFISGLLRRYSGQDDIRLMGGFFKEKPFLMVLFLIPALSLSGLPPTSGFWAKYLILQAAFKLSYWISAVIVMAVGFFTLFSMVKIWRYAFLQPASRSFKQINRTQELMLYLPVLFLGALTFLIGLFPETLYSAVHHAAEQLLGMHEHSFTQKET